MSQKNNQKFSADGAGTENPTHYQKYRETILKSQKNYMSIPENRKKKQERDKEQKRLKRKNEKLDKELREAENRILNELLTNF